MYDRCTSRTLTASINLLFCSGLPLEHRNGTLSRCYPQISLLNGAADGAPPKWEDNEDSSMCAFDRVLLTDGRPDKRVHALSQSSRGGEECPQREKRSAEGRQSVRQCSQEECAVLSVIRLLLLFKPDNVSEQRRFEGRGRTEVGGGDGEGRKKHSRN